MIEAVRASSIASAGLSKLVSFEQKSFEVVMISIPAGRSGADVVLGEQAKSRVDAFSLISSCFNISREMPSKKVDHIEVANSESLEDFIAEYLPPGLVPFHSQVCSIGRGLKAPRPTIQYLS